MKLKDIFKILTEEHNFLNLFWLNFHKVDEGVYRSAQILPWKLKKIIKKYGIKTIINLRGDNKNYLYRLEKNICKEMGVEYHTVSIKSRNPEGVSKEEYKRLINLLITSKKPLLFHCKAGADRTGFVAVLWHLLQGRDKNWAIKKELRLKYMYLPWSKAGKIRKLFEAYDGKSDLIEWIEKNKTLIKSFESNRFADFIADRVLRRE
ncbi:MAG: tyrosine-protein phosphatase [Nautiliaceae bacterium]